MNGQMDMILYRLMNTTQRELCRWLERAQQCRGVSIVQITMTGT